MATGFEKDESLLRDSEDRRSKMRLRSGRGRDLVCERLAHALQLGHALEGEQKRDGAPRAVCSTCVNPG